MSRPVHFVVFLLSLAVRECSSLLEECITANGVQYRGEQQKSSSGSLCLTWNSTDRDYDVTLYPDLATGVGDHNYCRNPDDSDQPWCYVSGADGQLQREACAIQACQDKNCTGAVTCTMSPSGDEYTTAEQMKSAEGGAVQPVVGASQRVRLGPKKKKDLGTIGMGRDLKKQHEQRVYEREMHRITLPLSAFANPTCELVDENAIVVAPESIEQAPSQGVVEGSDPLIDSVGTPGA
ncbi:Phosphoinositide-3-kinase-interacting protein 1 [Bagarius yarrelli]|uniref:Phosphoinositide-3-kinase-interacting protein 1 n=1 Tax=Bagarius yarrelli TaxID=175774 RepID=A0A556U800_BAGYA|nr:Phosphoinositide-3-kinase-interacting protein 1 [Bagarius yarrelli]